MWEWPESARETIRSALSDDEPAVRLRAVGLVAEIADDELAGELLRIIREDSDPEVSARAAIALGPALEMYDIEGLGADFDAGEPLSERVFEQIVAELEAVYRDASAPVLVRRRALEAAVRAPREWQEAAARAAFEAEDLDWQVTAVFCMGHLRGFDRQILKALDSDVESLVLEAVVAAGQADVVEASSRVLDLAAATDTTHALRVAAIGALGRLNPKGSKKLLTEMRRSPDAEILAAAEDALEELTMLTSLGE
jgi:HEAT repeat protein